MKKKQSKPTAVQTGFSFFVETKQKEHNVKEAIRPQKVYNVTPGVGIGDGKDFGNYIKNLRGNRI